MREIIVMLLLMLLFISCGKESAGNECVNKKMVVLVLGGCDRHGYCGVIAYNKDSIGRRIYGLLSYPVAGMTFDSCDLKREGLYE